MSRSALLVPFAAVLLLVPAGSAGDVAPAPRPKAAAVAPFPRVAGGGLDVDLTTVDVGLDVTLPAVEREADVTAVPVAEDPLGPPNVAIPELKLPAGTRPAGGLKPDLPPGGGKLSPYAGRTGETKEKLLKSFGGNSASERAVAIALGWLALQQQRNGSWVFDGTAKDEMAAATGFALLAFLGTGETHKVSKNYKKTIEMGLEWLLADLTVAGKFKSAKTMYGQGIATLALCEAFGMTQDPTLKKWAESAIDYIQSSQAADGSWGYTAGSRGDTSILGWQVQALDAAKTAGLTVDANTIKRAIGFLDNVAGGDRRNTFGYTDATGAREGSSLTAVGLWCRIHIGTWTPKTEALTDGVEGLMKRAVTTAYQVVPDMYFVHYATQVVRDFGGDPWVKWFQGTPAPEGVRKGGLRDALVSLQVKKDGDKKGSWDPDPGFIGQSCGRVGTTALAVLALESPYRHLPRFKPAVEQKSEPEPVRP